MTRDVEGVRSENRIKRWFRETRAELTKVTWPTRQEGMRLTGIVIVVTIVSGIAIFAIDSLFSGLIGLFLSLT
jgi:preprotein translocase subunit SecE